MSRKKKYPVRIPRYAAGIRAQELRTGAGRSWWARRWMQTMERMGLGARLGRGRNYAMSGQVTRMTLAGPRVEACRPPPLSVCGEDCVSRTRRGGPGKDRAEDQVGADAGGKASGR